MSQIDDLGQPLVNLRYEKEFAKVKRSKYTAKPTRTSALDVLFFVVSGVVPALIYGGCYAMGYQLTDKACGHYACYTVILPEFWICAAIHAGWYWLVVKMGKK